VFVNVALLGLSCALNPVLLAVVLLTLSTERPKRMLGAYVAGAFTWSVGLGIGVVSVASNAEAFGGHASPSRPIFDIVAGGVLLAGSLWYASGRAAQRKARRVAAKEAKKAVKLAKGNTDAAQGGAGGAGADAEPKEPKPPLSERLLSGPIPLAFVAGVVLNFPSVRYIEAMKEIVVANVSQQQQILAILLFNVLMLSPAIVPLALIFFRPDTTRAAITRMDAWTRTHSQALLSTVLAAVGLYLTIKGIAALV
jgi:Sap, sulfolipid-1-addressing protein